MELNDFLLEFNNKYSLIVNSRHISNSVYVDMYRKDCDWVCGECGFTMSYIDSIIVREQPYVHEMRCINTVGEKGNICNRKMHLHKDDGSSFSSSSFDRLYRKYQKNMIKESVNSSSVDNPNEIYSHISSCFMKIVGMFNRVGNLTKKSDKWFSSFFWQSVQNKIADLKKTNNYRKRAPVVKCALCDKDICQMTTKHLFSPGHEIIMDEILIEVGKNALFDSGEYRYYNEGDQEWRERCRYLGSLYLEKHSKEEQKKFYDKRAMNVYFRLFPKFNYQNEVLSVNNKISDDSELEMGEFKNEGVGQEEKFCDTSAVERMDMENLTNLIISKIMGSEINKKKIKSFFKRTVEDEECVEIMKKILYDKASFKTVKNIDLDKSFSEIRKIGLSAQIIKMAKNISNCRMLIMNR